MKNADGTVLLWHGHMLAALWCWATQSNVSAMGKWPIPRPTERACIAYITKGLHLLLWDDNLRAIYRIGDVWKC